MHYLHLNLKITDILTNKNILFKGVDPAKYESWHWELSVNDLHKDFVDIVNQLGLTVEHVHVFKTNPFNKSWTVHRDWFLDSKGGENLIDIPKLNWIYGDNTTVMTWYQTNNGIDNPIKVNSVNSEDINASYYKYNSNDVHKIDQTVIAQSSIIQAGVPHDVMNSSGKNRWCVSVLFSKDNQHIGMEELTNLFKDYTINI